jgi:hypothetical protein
LLEFLRLAVALILEFPLILDINLSEPEAAAFMVPTEYSSVPVEVTSPKEAGHFNG